MNCQLIETSNKKEALYPNVCETSEEYINLLIESEQSQKKDGYKVLYVFG